MNRGRSPLAITIGILVALGALFAAFSGIYIDWLWFGSVDFSSVWTTVLTTKIELFAIFGLLTSLIITSNIVIAYRKRPLYVPTSFVENPFDRLRTQIQPVIKWVGVAIFAAVLVPITYAMLRDRPSDVGLLPYGASEEPPAGVAAPATARGT